MKSILALFLSVPLLAQSAEQLEFFEKKVRPIFAANCYSCHGPKTQMAGLNFSSAAGFEQVVVKGDSAQSRLYQAVSYTEKIKMPPPGKLAGHEIDDLKAWIDMGAPWPKEAPVPVTANPRITEGRKFWAFQPVKDYPPPKVNNVAWVKTPIDRFILAKLEEMRIRPASPAPKLTLLRRVTYDLIGLPPTSQEIDAFLADSSPEAYAKVVDRLLASPQYGERWGRHWLDVARYADSTGMDEDHIYPYAWRYRDYVVKAFNDDLPYDRFVMEQLAGDLLPAEKPGAVNERGIVATGFLALGPKPLAQQDRMKMIYDVVDEQIDTASKAFMGLTVACARCHDHKFDPILTKDYYSLASIFASSENFRNLGRPGAVSYIYDAPLDPVAFERYQSHRWRMYGKQLELEEALAEDAARENALLRPKIAESLVATFRAGETKWSRWLHSVDEKARQGYLKKLFDATDSLV
jgi:cytochrome c553